MASAYQPTPLPYNPITGPTATNPIGFNNTSDARKLAENQRQYMAGIGDSLMANDQNLANQYASQMSGTQAYLNPIMNTLATGGGGYNTSEQGQIELSPQDKQNIITSAGISAGAGNAAAVNAAERAAAAAGGNPMALATYRARAARDQSAQAGDAMTKARVAAQQAGSQGAQTVGNARMAQQQQGLGYYQNLQNQQQQAALQEQQLQHGAYGTEAGATGAAAGLGLQASQTPSTFDKIMGAAGGALSALADGTYGYFADGKEAVVGEDGPEMILENGKRRRYMQGGGFSSDDPGDDAFGGVTGTAPNSDLPIASGNYGATADAAMMKPVKAPGFFSNLASKLNPTQPQSGGQQQQQQQQPQQQWNKTTPYQQMGAGIGKLAALAFLADGTAPYGYVGKVLDAAPEGRPPEFENLRGRSYPTQIGAENDEGDTYDAYGREIDRHDADLVMADGHFADGLPAMPGTSAKNEPWRVAIDQYTARPIRDEGGRVNQIAVNQRHAVGLTPYMADGSPMMGPPTERQEPAFRAEGGGDGTLSADEIRGTKYKFPPYSRPAGEKATLTGYGEPSLTDYKDFTPKGVYQASNRQADRIVQRGKEGAYGHAAGVIEDWASKATSPDAAGNWAMDAAAERYQQQHYKGDAAKIRGEAQRTYDRERQPAAHKADGDGGLPAPTFNPSKLITSPTRVHLDPGDQVVPLTYRPKAKIRPSAALPALGNTRLNPRLRHTYGAIRT